MKKIFVLLALIFLAVFPVHAYDASDAGWVIDNFNSKINISSDQTVSISEKIDVDFGNLSKHGIYRYIPYKYDRKGNKYNIRINIDSVKDNSGNNIKYQKSTQSGNVVLKIGDENKTISGKQTYSINYHLERAINRFSDHDELYLNITGNDWPVEIKNTRTEISWPENSQITDNTCFAGIYASQNQECQINKNNNIIFQANNSLNPGEGMTVVSGIKPGLLKNYPWTKIVGWFLADNWGYLIPVLALILLLVTYFKKGRDPKGRMTIAPEFAPPGKLLPAELGTIYDERVDAKDISAIIIDLAVKGYLTIRELKQKKFLGFVSKDFEFQRTKKKDVNLQNYEKEVLSGIFEDGESAKLSDLQKSFFKHVKSIKDNIYDKIVKNGYFVSNPEATRNSYMGIGTAILVISFFVIFSIFRIADLAIIIGLALSGLLFIIFAFAMPKRTEKGVEINRQIKGFRMYMYTAERYRQKFFEDKHIFERFLPYAMVFGITKKWAEAFKDLDVPRPSWYYGQGNFYPIIFVISLNNFQNSANATLITPPSSAGAGGSGFSGGGAGGGFGGGGGGSW